MRTLGVQFDVETLDTSKRSLLFVDDEDYNLSALRRVFHREGYKVYTANSAHEALAILANVPIGVIVSDERMPEISGTQLLARVRSLYPNTRRIILSGFADLATLTNAFNDGAIHKFLTKPWNDDALRRDIRQGFRLHANDLLAT